MRRFVLDTSSILRDWTVLERLPSDAIALPLRVLDELDAAKRYRDDTAWNARQAIKAIERQNFEILFVEPEPGEDPDATIIRSAVELAATFKVLLTEDYGMMVRARAKGLEAETADTILGEGREPGVAIELSVEKELIDDLHETGSVEVAELPHLVPLFTQLRPWAPLILKNAKQSALAVWNGESVSLCRKTEGVSATAKCAEQSFALWALNAREIPLVALTGPAGTGKSFLTFASAFEAVKQRKFKRLVVVRNFQEVGKGLGFLPGTLEEKLDPWLDAMRDTFRALYGEEGVAYFEMSVKKGVIEIVPLSLIRGRTFEKSFVVLDEAQNTSPHEIKTVVTRMGMGSKLVLLGDTYQIDSPGAGEHSCGLSHVIRGFKHSKLAAHCHLKVTQRSDLAAEAAKLL